MSHRGLNAIFALLICVSAVLMLGNLTQGHNWGGDFAAYIMQAKSLTELDPAAFVESNRFTVEQSSHPRGPIAPCSTLWTFWSHTNRLEVCQRCLMAASTFRSLVCIS